MALTAYLRLKGAKQGDIRGSVVQKGRQGRIAVIAASHGIVSPRDSVSGMATGKRMHKPLLITKELDKSTPLLLKALVDSETITSFTLDFFSPGTVGAGGSGVEVNDFTITLQDAQIASVETTMPNNRQPDLAKLATFEEIAFTYSTITWTWVDGAISAQDEWGAPLV